MSKYGSRKCLLPTLGGLGVACWLTLLVGCQGRSSGLGSLSLPNPFKSTGTSVAKSRIWKTVRPPAAPNREPARDHARQIARARDPVAAATYDEARTAFRDVPISDGHPYPQTYPYPETQAWPRP